MSSKNDKECLLSQKFLLYPKKTVAQVTLTNEAITVASTSSNPKASYVIKLDDVIGCHVIEGNTTTSSRWYLCIFSYPLKKKVFNGLSRHRVTKSLGISQSNDNEENKAIAEKWKSAIKHLIVGNRLTNAEDVPAVSPRRYLVYVNPFSGSGKALQIYENEVRRLFAEAEITHTMFKTDYAGHTKEDVRTVDLSKYDGIVIVSGDGLIHEVINGLMERPDWETAIKTPIGVVPGGSGNALAASIVYASTGHMSTENLLQDSLYEIARARTRDLSIMHVQLREKSFYSFLNIGWGFVADVDIESEKYRFLGTARFTMGTFIRVARLHKYQGMISYVPTDDEAYFSLNQQSLSKSKISEQRTRVASTTDFVIGNGVRTPQTSAEDALRTSTIPFQSSLDSTPGNNNISVAEGEALPSPDVEGSSFKSAMSIDIEERSPDTEIEPPVLSLEKDVKDDVTKPPYYLKSSLSEPIPENWKTIEGDFIFIMPVYLSHIGDDMLTIPTAKLEEPVMYLYCLKHGMSKLRLTRYFLGYEDGTHLDIGGDYVSVIPCKAFRLEPFTNHTGYMTVDGELIPHEPLQASITPITTRVLASSPS